MSPMCISVPPLPLHRNRMCHLFPSVCDYVEVRGHLTPPNWRGNCRAQHLGRQYGLWLIAPVGEVDTLAHVLPAGLGVHRFRENLQAVAVGVEEVDAVGHAVVG